MRKIIITFLSLFLFTCHINAENNINNALYNVLSTQENIIRNKIENINLNILENAVKIIDEQKNYTDSIDRKTMYIFLRDMFNSEIENRKTSTININNANVKTKIKITFGNNELIAEVEDNNTARDFISLLPLTIDLNDYANTEKVFDLSKRLDTNGASAGYDPNLGDIAYYSPWGNVAIYYKDFSYSSGLIPIGKIVSGIEKLNISGSIKEVKFERIE